MNTNFLRAFFFALLSAALGMAQTDLATVRGSVTDQTGAVVPKVKVVLTNIGTNSSRDAETNDNGDFEIPYVVQGSYKLTTTAAGFKNYTDYRIKAHNRDEQLECW